MLDCLGALLNEVVSIEDSAVLFFGIYCILTACLSACKFYSIQVSVVCRFSAG